MEKELDKLDVVEAISKDITAGWYPTVSDLKSKNVEKDLQKFSTLILFFAGDPLELPDADYKATVSYCKKLGYRLCE